MVRNRLSLQPTHDTDILKFSSTEHGKKHVLGSNNMSVTLQTEILTTETSDFLKQIINLESFNSMFYVAEQVDTVNFELFTKI